MLDLVEETEAHVVVGGGLLLGGSLGSWGSSSWGGGGGGSGGSSGSGGSTTRWDGGELLGALGDDVVDVLALELGDDLRI